MWRHWIFNYFCVYILPPPPTILPFLFLLYFFTFYKFSIFPITYFLNFPCFQFSWHFPILYFRNSHTSNFPDIFQVHIFHISHTSSFPDIFQLHIFHISNTSNFPDIFQFHIFGSSNFLYILLFSFFKFPYFQFSQIAPNFYLTLRFSQIFSDQVLFHSNFVPSIPLSTLHFLPAVPVLQSSSHCRYTVQRAVRGRVPSLSNSSCST